MAGGGDERKESRILASWDVCSTVHEPVLDKNG